MSPIIATTFWPGASPLPAGAASTVPAASMPGTRGKLTPTPRPSRSFSSERLRPNASTRMRTQPSRSGGSGSVVSRRLPTGPGAESSTARMVAGEDVMSLPSAWAGESVGSAQHAAAAASFRVLAPGFPALAPGPDPAGSAPWLDDRLDRARLGDRPQGLLGLGQPEPAGDQPGQVDGAAGAQPDGRGPGVGIPERAGDRQLPLLQPAQRQRHLIGSHPDQHRPAGRRQRGQARADRGRRPRAVQERVELLPGARRGAVVPGD